MILLYCLTLIRSKFPEAAYYSSGIRGISTVNRIILSQLSGKFNPKFAFPYKKWYNPRKCASHILAALFFLHELIWAARQFTRLRRNNQ